MMSTNSISPTNSSLKFDLPRKKIQLQMFSEPSSPGFILNQLASIEGPVDVYFWYEGSKFLPECGATFMKEQLFMPLHQLKPNAKLCLYSLRGWDFKRNITEIASSTLVGDAINRINRRAIECIFSSSFFQYCTQVSEQDYLYAFISDELPKKNWLFDLSAPHKKINTTVEDFFNHRSNLFDCIKDLDVASSYSFMQYIEGYYLIRTSIEKALLIGKKKIEIAFVLPNDEGKYYHDLPNDIEKMLELDFGTALDGVEVNISFHSFRYGENITARPYIDKRSKARQVEPQEIRSYFHYLLPRQSTYQEEPRMPFLRDYIHNINGW